MNQCQINWNSLFFYYEYGSPLFCTTKKLLLNKLVHVHVNVQTLPIIAQRF
jgi:hypothetical protein